MGLVLGGGNPLRHISMAYVNRTLILVCVLFFVTGVRPEPFAFVPAYMFGIGDLPGPLPTIDAWRGLFGHVFIHSDLLHLLANMVALWVFGDNVEDALGHGRYLVFFFLCAAAGAVAEGAMAAEPLRPLVGASGAISGVMGAYLLLHPHAKILLLLFFRIPILLPASVVVGGDIAANIAMVLLPPVPGIDADGVAWGAHLGGFAAGILLLAPFKRRGVPLFLPPEAYPAVPFPRLQTILVDFFPGPHAPRGGGSGGRAVVMGKAAAYLGLVAVLVWTL